MAAAVGSTWGATRDQPSSTVLHGQRAPKGDVQSSAEKPPHSVVNEPCGCSSVFEAKAVYGRTIRRGCAACTAAAILPFLLRRKMLSASPTTCADLLLEAEGYNPKRDLGRESSISYRGVVLLKPKQSPETSFTPHLPLKATCRAPNS